MVKIINGEIFADDDPRLRQQSSPPPISPGPDGSGYGGTTTPRLTTPPGGTGGGGGAGFNLNAPPLKFVPPAPGSQPLFGLPDMEIFGVLVTPYAVLAAAALGMVMGWRGVMVALILYYVYLASQARAGEPGQAPRAGPQGGQGNQQQQQGQGQGQGSGGNPMDFLQNYLNGPRPRGPGGAPGGGSDGQRGVRLGGGDDAPGAGRSAAGSGGGGWAAFQGKGNKLGGTPK